MISPRKSFHMTSSSRLDTLGLLIFESFVIPEISEIEKEIFSKIKLY